MQSKAKRTAIVRLLDEIDSARFQINEKVSAVLNRNSINWFRLIVERSNKAVCLKLSIHCPKSGPAVDSKRVESIYPDLKKIGIDRVIVYHYEVIGDEPMFSFENEAPKKISGREGTKVLFKEILSHLKVLDPKGYLDKDHFMMRLRDRLSSQGIEVLNRMEDTLGPESVNTWICDLLVSSGRFRRDLEGSIVPA
jgi:hypothetical protein